MATTRYFILAGDFTEVRDVKSKRAVALDEATAIRANEKTPVVVVTGAGTIIFEAKARKAQKKTKPYTRVVALPAGVVVPDGQRVAYTRGRKGLAVLHSFDELYTIFDYVKGERVATFDTTRQAGRFLADMNKQPEPALANA